MSNNIFKLIEDRESWGTSVLMFLIMIPVLLFLMGLITIPGLNDGTPKKSYSSINDECHEVVYGYISPELSQAQRDDVASEACWDLMRLFNVEDY